MAAAFSLLAMPPSPGRIPFLGAGGKDLDLPPDAGRRAGQACHVRFIAPFPAASCLRS